MQKIVTADQFVAGIVAELALSGRRKFNVTGTELDAKFAKAFDSLLDNREKYSVNPNFAFYVDPIHGDSACLRDTLHAAKQKELIAFNNPTLRTFTINLTEERANSYIQKNPLPNEFLSEIVATCFSESN